nr:DUF3021 family protein [uncultured Cellulosilyticum sp.]
MRRLKELAAIFAWVTTGIVIASTIFIGIFYSFEVVTSNILWQILICSLICTLGSLVYPNKELSKKLTAILTIIYYLYINLVVLGCGLIFEWFNMNNLGMVIVMLILIALVFISVWGISIYKSKRLADEMNRRLEIYHNQEK